MHLPEDRRYTKDHEWAMREGERVRIGITEYAQDALGDVVFVQLPQLGITVEAGGECGEVESTKSVSDVYAPVAGTVVEVNTELAEAPERLNEDPYGAGWICLLEPSDPSSLDALLDAEAYEALTSDVATTAGTGE